MNVYGIERKWIYELCVRRCYPCNFSKPRKQLLSFCPPRKIEKKKEKCILHCPSSLSINGQKCLFVFSYLNGGHVTRFDDEQ